MEAWRKELYLAHHGIKGQRWGVRKGPPYSLTCPDHSTSEKKAGWKRSLDKSAQTPKKKSKPAKPEQSLKVLSKPNEPSELHETPTPITAKFLAKLIPSIAERQHQYKDYDVKNKDGVVVGDFSTNRDSADELNVVWLGIKGKYEGKGYGQSAMRLMIDDARKEGIKRVTLEVPTNSPNARHIYEKLGFKDTGEAMLGDENDVWGGLTKMRLDL